MIFICTLVAGVVIARLVVLMVVEHDQYVALAAGSQELYAQLFPTRGEIVTRDIRGEEYPLAMNRDTFVVYANTREILNDEIAEDVAEALAEVFGYDDEKKLALYLKMKERNDPYEPLEQGVEEAVAERLKSRHLPGIGFVRRSERFYPEKTLAAHVVGFVGKNTEGEDIGRYGIEGYWNDALAGSGGFFAGARSATGRWITLSGRTFRPSIDGAEIVLTIDRTIQFKACEELRQAMEKYGAKSASLIIMEPGTGAIRAMCSLPDFDPNTYSQVSSVDIFNNSAIFTPYEPGSIFKPITIAAALNEEVVTPQTKFYDSGSRDGVCSRPIQNADHKVYKDQTMVGVLENSINTGLVFVVDKVGKKRFREYVERFGFGVKEGLPLDTEVSGTIESLSKNPDDKLDCYTATASFGQGITVTPLQMVTAFSAIANGGRLMKPYVVEEARYSDGRVERTKSVEIRSVMNSRAAALLKAMLVSVVDKGQGRAARVPGYYVAGKTGTAQISGPGGYTEDTNHSFIGFAPVDDPKFVMIIKFEKPQLRFASYTATPTFGEIAKFLLQYYEVPPGRDKR